MASIVYPHAGIAVGLFALVFLYFPVRLYRSGGGFGDFSVGMSYEDMFLIILAFVPLVAATNYLFTLLGLGMVEAGTRTFSFIRYFEWTVSTPFMLVGIGLLTQRSQLLAKLIGMDVLMLVTGFLASVMTSQLRWVALAVSVAAMLHLLYLLLRVGRAAMENRPKSLQSLFRRVTWFTVGVWAIYPVFWVVSQDGLGIVGVTNTLLGFMVLDLISKGGYILFIAQGVGDLATVDTGLD